MTSVIQPVFCLTAGTVSTEQQHPEVNNKQTRHTEVPKNSDSSNELPAKPISSHRAPTSNYTVMKKIMFTARYENKQINKTFWCLANFCFSF